VCEEDLKTARVGKLRFEGTVVLIDLTGAYLPIWYPVLIECDAGHVMLLA